MKLLIPLMISIQATTTEPGEACPGKFSDFDKSPSIIKARYHLDFEFWKN